MSSRAKKGFTIVEMLMVLGVIAILLGIVTTVAMSAIKHARTRKAEAIKQQIQNAITTYKVQQGEWPGVIQSWCDNGLPSGTTTKTLSNEEYDTVLSELAEMSYKKSQPLMDISGIMVSPKGGKGNWCSEFSEAIKKDHAHGGGIKFANMAYGYVTVEGNFSRCKITYNAETDHVTVGL